MIQPYRSEIEQAMKKYYATLSEKDQRRYAGVEALKLGLGGKSYIAKILGCSERTVHKGIEELAQLPDDAKYDPTIRKSGGGRKRYDEYYPNIDEQFLKILQQHTDRNLIDEYSVWPDLTSDEISKLLEQEHQVKVSNGVIKKLFKKHNYRGRKTQNK